MVIGAAHTAPDQGAWGVVSLRGGDCALDESAVIIADACGPAPRATSLAAAALVGVEEMLFSLRELLAPDACPAGLLIRAPDIAVATLAGLQIPADVCPTLRRRVRDLWSEARAQAGGQIWLAGMPPSSAWRSRVTSLANVGYMGPWGALNPQRQLGGPGPGPGWGQSDDRECPVCLDEYFEFLPHPHRREDDGWVLSDAPTHSATSVATL